MGLYGELITENYKLSTNNELQKYITDAKKKEKIGKFTALILLDCNYKEEIKNLKNDMNISKWEETIDNIIKNDKEVSGIWMNAKNKKYYVVDYPGEENIHFVLFTSNSKSYMIQIKFLERIKAFTEI